MSLSINGKTIKSLTKDGKEIVKIEKVEDGKILYEKESNNNYVVATVTGNNARLGRSNLWLGTTGDVIIDWGDGTSDIVNNPTQSLSHTYSDGEQSHNITFVGIVTSLDNGCFENCTNLTSVVISNSVTSLGSACFNGCTGLTSLMIPNSVVTLGSYCFYRCTSLPSVVIPNSVVSLGTYCFLYCSSLIDYQLHWTGNNIIAYNSNKIPNNTNSTFTIPVGETANYVAKGYPSDKLVEREPELIEEGPELILISSLYKKMILLLLPLL